MNVSYQNDTCLHVTQIGSLMISKVVAANQSQTSMSEMADQSRLLVSCDRYKVYYEITFMRSHEKKSRKSQGKKR